MEKSIKITGIIALTILVLGLLAYSAFSSLLPTNTVTGNGQATIKAIPDLVTIYFEIQTEAETNQEASQQNSEIVDDLRTALIRIGFENNQIQTTSFNVYPDYNYRNGNQITGYTASHQIKIEISTDTETKGGFPINVGSRIGEVIDAGVEAGAGISYINFELSQEKQNKYKADAIKLAAQDATIKAQAMAEGLGKKLGRLVSTSYSNFDYYPLRLYEASSGASAEDAKQATTNIQPGEQEVSARVTAIYKLR